MTTSRCRMPGASRSADTPRTALRKEVCRKRILFFDKPADNQNRARPHSARDRRTATTMATSNTIDTSKSSSMVTAKLPVPKSTPTSSIRAKPDRQLHTSANAAYTQILFPHEVPESGKVSHQTPKQHRSRESSTASKSAISSRENLDSLDSTNTESNNCAWFSDDRCRMDIAIPSLSLEHCDDTKKTFNEKHGYNVERASSDEHGDIDEYAFDLGLSTHRPKSRASSSCSFKNDKRQDTQLKISQHDSVGYTGSSTSNYLDVDHLQSILGDQNYKRYLQNCQEDDDDDSEGLGSDTGITHNFVVDDHATRKSKKNFCHAWCAEDEDLVLKTHRPSASTNAAMSRDSLVEQTENKSQLQGRRDVHFAFSADEIYAEADHFWPNYPSMDDKPVKRVDVHRSTVNGRNIFECPSQPCVSQGQTKDCLAPTYKMESSEAMFEMSQKRPLPTRKTHVEGIRLCVESRGQHGIGGAYTNTALQRYFTSLEGLVHEGSDVDTTRFERLPEMDTRTKHAEAVKTSDVSEHANWCSPAVQCESRQKHDVPSSSAFVSNSDDICDNDDDLTRVTDDGRPKPNPPLQPRLVADDDDLSGDVLPKENSDGITARLRKLGIDFKGLKEKARNEISRKYNEDEDDDTLSMYDHPTRGDDVFLATGFSQQKSNSSSSQTCPDCQSAIKLSNVERCEFCGCRLFQSEERTDVEEYQNRTYCDNIIFSKNHAEGNNSIHSPARSSGDFVKLRTLQKDYLKQDVIDESQDVQRTPRFGLNRVKQDGGSSTSQAQQTMQHGGVHSCFKGSAQYFDECSGAGAFAQHLERSWEDNEFTMGGDILKGDLRSSVSMIPDNGIRYPWNSFLCDAAGDDLVASLPEQQPVVNHLRAMDPLVDYRDDNAALADYMHGEQYFVDSRIDSSIDHAGYLFKNDDKTASPPLRHQFENNHKPTVDSTCSASKSIDAFTRQQLQNGRKVDINKMLNASDPHLVPLPEREIGADLSLQLGDSINSSTFDKQPKVPFVASASAAVNPSDDIDFEYTNQMDPRYALSNDMRGELSLNLSMSHDSSLGASGPKLTAEHPPNDIPLQRQQEQVEAVDLVDESIAVINSNYTEYVSQIVNEANVQPSNDMMRPKPSVSQPGRSRPQHGGNTEASSLQKCWPQSTTWSSSFYDKFARQSSGAKLARSRNGKSAKLSKSINRNRESDSVDVSDSAYAEGIRQMSRSGSGEGLKRHENARKSRNNAIKATRCSKSFAPNDMSDLVVQSAEVMKAGRLTKSAGLMDKNYSKYLSMAQGFTGRLYNRPSSATYRKQATQDMSPRISAGELTIWQCLPEELILYIFSFLSHSVLAKTARVCRQFRRIITDTSLWHSIEVRSRTQVTDAWLSEMGRHRPRRLLMSRCRGDDVTASGLRELFRETADCLTELSMTGCNEGVLTGDHILLHAASRCNNITHLDMSWSSANDNGVISISDSSNPLQSLSLNGCQLITDAALCSLLKKHGRHLKTLELFGCFCLTSHTIASIRDHCHGLVTLNLGHCWKLTDECIVDLCQSLSVLENIDLRGCKQVTDASVRHIASSCPKLVTLSVANCIKLTDVSLVEISTNCAQIRSLDAYGCQRLTNVGVRAIATCCQDLELIDLSSTGITHKSVSLLANYCAHRLKIVKLNFCKHITMCCLVRLAKNCHRLEKLFLYGVKGLRSLDEVQNSNPSLWIET